MKGVKEKAILSWSGGKDNAPALYRMQEARDCEVVSLLSTTTRWVAKSRKVGGRWAYRGTRLISLS
jgi:hypothetical protein